MSQGQKFPKSRVNITSFYPKPRPISYRHPHMSNQYIPIRIYISLWLLFTYLYLLLLSVVSLNRANFIFHVISSHTATRTHAHNACSRPASRYQTTAVACKSRNKYVLAKPQVFTRISISWCLVGGLPCLVIIVCWLLLRSHTNHLPIFLWFNVQEWSESELLHPGRLSPQTPASSAKQPPGVSINTLIKYIFEMISC